ncbi:MAG: serine--tRNA synthetase, partial [Acholeplasmataceae bacterium]|nr:serine--tRNA synthetase [Acholeplasmataceae bacterium]
MLDIKLIREDVEGVIRRLQTRGGDYSYLRTVYQLDEE